MDRLATAYNRQKSYADNTKRPLEFDVGDHVYLKISPMKGKSSPRYIGPYEILQRVGKVAYELTLHTELVSVHQIFYVSVLKKCLGDTTSILPVEGLGFDEDFSNEEVPIKILDRQVKRLRNKEIVTLKVLWRNHLVEGAT
ncbi:uncharacterized protein [Solanum lycopersicum]|uniref:uncharacterized protein n=1 Tax=Solanum lycopersicum TaxID=4081 RepID=UPI0037479E8B